MDYHTLRAELERYFDELQALAELKGMDLNIAACLNNCTTYLEGALEIAREKNPQQLGIPYRWIVTNTAPDNALDIILALEDSSTPIKGE